MKLTGHVSALLFAVAIALQAIGVGDLSLAAYDAGAGIGIACAVIFGLIWTVNMKEEEGRTFRMLYAGLRLLYAIWVIVLPRAAIVMVILTWITLAAASHCLWQSKLTSTVGFYAMISSLTILQVGYTLLGVSLSIEGATALIAIGGFGAIVSFYIDRETIVALV